MGHNDTDICNDIHIICNTNNDWKFILEEEGCEALIKNAIDTWDQIKHMFPTTFEPTLMQKIIKYLELQILKLKDIL